MLHISLDVSLGMLLGSKAEAVVLYYTKYAEVLTSF